MAPAPPSGASFHVCREVFFLRFFFVLDINERYSAIQIINVLVSVASHERRRSKSQSNSQTSPVQHRAVTHKIAVHELLVVGESKSKS